MARRALYLSAQPRPGSAGALRAQGREAQPGGLRSDLWRPLHRAASSERRVASDRQARKRAGASIQRVRGDRSDEYLAAAVHEPVGDDPRSPLHADRSGGAGASLRPAHSHPHLHRCRGERKPCRPRRSRRTWRCSGGPGRAWRSWPIENSSGEPSPPGCSSGDGSAGRQRQGLSPRRPPQTPSPWRRAKAANLRRLPPRRSFSCASNCGWKTSAAGTIPCARRHWRTPTAPRKALCRRKSGHLPAKASEAPETGFSEASRTAAAGNEGISPRGSTGSMPWRRRQRR